MNKHYGSHRLFEALYYTNAHYTTQIAKERLEAKVFPVSLDSLQSVDISDKDTNSQSQLVIHEPHQVIIGTKSVSHNNNFVKKNEIYPPTPHGNVDFQGGAPFPREKGFCSPNQRLLEVRACPKGKRNTTLWRGVFELLGV